jgi:hypothetical protein
MQVEVVRKRKGNGQGSVTSCPYRAVAVPIAVSGGDSVTA